jgi:hypothetical protein
MSIFASVAAGLFEPNWRTICPGGKHYGHIHGEQSPIGSTVLSMALNMTRTLTMNLS